MLVRRSAFTFCAENDIRHPFHVTKNVAGKDWLYSFLKRNPQLSKRKAQLMNPGRAQKLNKFIVNDYFAKLSDIYTEMNIQQNPQNLFNMDEKGCRLTIHHQQQIIGKRGAKRIHLVAPEHAENVTIAGCCNALGNSIPPMIIFKGKRMKPEWQDGLPPGTLVKMADKGSMTTELFIAFIKHLARYKGNGPALLIFDGASSHLDVSIVDAADRLEIRLFCLPSNTTHELQPLDKAVYRSFEHHWDQELLRYWDTHPDRRLNKSRFSHIFSKVWPKCMMPENIINGFRATGMYPLDPNIIPESAFAPSLATQRAPEAIEQPQQRSEVMPKRVKSVSNINIQTNNYDSDESEENVPLSTLKEMLNDLAAAKEQLQNKTPVKCSNANDPHATIQQIMSDSTSALNISNEDLNKSFKELLPTPELFTTKNKKIANKKSLNYRAQAVTKDLFLPTTNPIPKSLTSKKSAQQPTPSTSKGPVKRLLTENLPKDDLWYCFVCQTKDKLDMRQCVTCGTWCHEACIGFTKDDVEDFICPRCY